MNELSTLCERAGINLDDILENKDSYYRTFYIRKKDNKPRPIDAPFGDLITAQKICVKYLSDKKDLVHDKAKAFRKGVSLRHNAAPHINKRKVLKIDLKDFFGSIKQDMVARILGDKIADLVCYRGRLPQGAPTSPIVSNIIAYNLDCQLEAWAAQHNLSYTRYADDMSFSGDSIPESYRRDLNRFIRSQDLRINYKKTKLVSNNREQCITGVNVNKIASISKRKCRHKLRAVLYYYGKNGMKLTEEIKGMLAYIKSINEQQYQKLVRDYERHFQWSTERTSSGTE